jgi:hypothetical protein
MVAFMAPAAVALLLVAMIPLVVVVLELARVWELVWHCLLQSVADHMSVGTL